MSVYVTNPTDVILDIDGYFDSSSGATSYSFYPASPCRIADTRNPAGVFGGPTMTGRAEPGFPHSLELLRHPGHGQGVLAERNGGPARVSWLSDNLAGGADAADGLDAEFLDRKGGGECRHRAGGYGRRSRFSSRTRRDVILDINGYFGASGGPGALSFYPVTPCRVADTRGAQDEFGGPEMTGSTARSFTVPASACHIPSNAAAYSLNVTVVPDGVLSYLTAWPTGSPQPQVSTLNSFDGAVVANAAVVPAGTGGAISVFVTNRTHVILDIDGYFAP